MDLVNMSIQIQYFKFWAVDMLCILHSGHTLRYRNIEQKIVN